MEKQTVFIKRYPCKGELPKVDNKEYLTDKGLLKFEGGNWFSWWQADQYTPAYPNFYLEEIVLPSEEWFIKEVEKLTNHSLNKEWRDTVSMGYLACANFILKQLKSNTNETNKI